MAWRTRGASAATFDESLVDGLLEEQMPSKKLLIDSAKLMAAAAAAGPVLHGRGTGRSGQGSLTWTRTRSRPGRLQPPRRTSPMSRSIASPRSVHQPSSEELLRGRWNKLTGGTIKVTEAPFADIRTKAIAEHLRQVRSISMIDRVARLDSRVRRPRGDRPDRRLRREVQGESDLQ